MSAHSPVRVAYRALALLLVMTTSQLGCTHFIARESDSAFAKGAKVTSRIVGGVATISGTEVYTYAAKKNEEIAYTSDPEAIKELEKERDTAILAYWLVVATVVIVTALVLVAASSRGDGPSSGGAVADVSQCGYRQALIHTDQGTCSWHGGVADCYGGIAVCADGNFNPGREACYVTCQ